MSADLSFGDIWRGGSRPMAREGADGDAQEAHSRRWRSARAAGPSLCRRSADLQDGGQRDGVLQDRQRSLVQPSLENLLPAWLAVLRQDQGRRVYLPNYR